MKIIMKTIKYLPMLLISLFEFLFLPILIFSCVIIRMLNSKVDIGIGINPNINHIRWANAIKRYGYKVETFVLGNTSYITQEFDCIYNKKIHMLFPSFLFLECASRYKIQILRMNGGLLSICKSSIKYLEPYLLKLANVKTVVIPYGSDCRILERTPNKHYAYTILQDAPIRTNKPIIKKVDIWCKNADIVVGQMDHVDYLPFWNKMRQSLHTIDVKNIKPVYPSTKDKIKIIHMFNHSMCKGTDSILEAVRELKTQGYDIELTYNSGITNNEVLELVSEADIIIDQLVIGWYASFAIEAMAFGKPTICYLRKDLVELYEKAGCIGQNEIPIISADTLTIKSVLADLIERKSELAEIGQKTRRYCEKYHSYEAVGEWFDSVIKSLDI